MFGLLYPGTTSLATLPWASRRCTSCPDVFFDGIDGLAVTSHGTGPPSGELDPSGPDALTRKQAYRVGDWLQRGALEESCEERGIRSLYSMFSSSASTTQTVISLTALPFPFRTPYNSMYAVLVQSTLGSRVEKGSARKRERFGKTSSGGRRGSNPRRGMSGYLLRSRRQGLQRPSPTRAVGMDGTRHRKATRSIADTFIRHRRSSSGRVTHAMLSLP